MITLRHSYYPLEDCEDAWDLRSIPEVVTSIDTTIVKKGSASAKAAVTNLTGPATVMAELVPPVDVTTNSSIKLWIRSSVNRTGNSFAIVLATGTNLDGTTQSLNIADALTANTWHEVTVNVTTAMTVQSIGINQLLVGPLSYNLYLDDVKIANHEKQYETLSIKGFNAPDDVAAWPAIVERTIDGTFYEKNIGINRMITVRFAALSRDEDLRQLFSFFFNGANGRSLIYDSEIVEVIIPRIERVAADWYEGISMSKMFTVEFMEKQLRLIGQSFPSSWTN